MAIAAQSFSELHIGLYQEENQTTTSDSDDEIINHDNSACIYEEFNLGIIFQNTLCFNQSHDSAIGGNEEFSYCENGEQTTPATENASVVEATLATDVNTKESEESTKANHDFLTMGDVVEECVVSNSVVEGTEIKALFEEVNDCSTTITDITRYDCTEEIKPNNDITDSNKETNKDAECEVKVKGDCATRVKDVSNKNVEEYELNHCHREFFSYGRPRQRVRKREKQKRKLEKRKVQRFVEPSEIGFHFYCTQIMTQPDCVKDDNEGNEHLAEEVDTLSESTSVASEDITASTSENRGNMSSISHTENTVEISDRISIDSASEKTQLDDESYFAELGIDINDSGAFEWDDYLNWDVITLVPAKSKSKRASPASKINNTKDTENKKNSIIAPAINTTDCDYSTPNYKMSTHRQIILWNLESNPSSVVYIRKDKHRKREKLHKAVKSQHCTIFDIINYKGRKTFYMHHRIVKKINLPIGNFRCYGRSQIPPMPREGIDLSVARAIKTRSKAPSAQNRRAPAQNLRHVLHETNVPRTIENDLASFLVSIQNRDLTPEDYEMLLRLDDTVKAKTISKDVLADLKTEPVGEDIANILNCVICMEPYLIGQTRKFLPCEHDFHSDCIDSWLSNNSQNCPLDGLPIADS